MPVKKKVISGKVAARGLQTRRTSSLSVPVYSLTGRVAGNLSLPKEVFGQEVNEKLLTQAVRVYLTNQKKLLASTKTRGEVKGSSAKIQRQKGTGRARHGSIRAPIFVGGGIVFGPKSRKVRLNLPQKMKKTALISALSAKLAGKGVIGLSGLEKASGKTKEMAQLLSQITKKQETGNKLKSALIITAERMDNVVRGTRNIPGVDVLPADLINAYEALKHDILLLTKDAVKKLSGKERKK